MTAAMREAGIEPGARGSRRRASFGWESLTRSEREITKLVGEGLRNADIARRLFISPRTVQSHLTRVFMKLGVRSRTELLARAARENEFAE
jgi:DNA-binding CsgD family transcriptional regulator